MDFPIILEISSSQLMNSIIFQRGRLNHQPDMVYHHFPIKWYKMAMLRADTNFRHGQVEEDTHAFQTCMIPG